MRIVHIDSKQKSKKITGYNTLSLAKSQSNALFSPKTRQILNNKSGYADTELPPFSPLDKELAMDESNHVFLIAGYPKYK
ncbi:9634_t:CDS:2, partial [Acaulospora morrowiae]